MRSFFNKKIPTAFGLLLLICAVLATSYLVNTGVIYLGGAAPSENPQDVRVTNISDSSFTVTYKTDAKVIGTMTLTSPTGTTTMLDDRDQVSGVPKEYMLHSISVKNLKPATNYSFSLTSGSTTYQNNGSLFETKTAPQFQGQPSSTKPVSGKLLNAQGSAPSEALVFITTAGGQQLSTLVQTNGVYILPLNTMLTSSLSGPIQLSDTTKLQLLATDGTSSTQAQIQVATANPIPLISLGNNYDFTITTTPVASESGSLGFPTFPQGQSFQATPVIITPKKDEGFSDAQPQFSGTALPDQNVTITIHSDAVVNATVTTDANGYWTYRPSVPLSPGSHIISITSKNAAGILTTIQQSFTVFASGSQVTQSATPSGKLSPTATPTPTVIPTAKPTATLSPTGLITPTPTLTPTIIPTTKVTPRPTLPPTGNNTLVTSSVLGIVTTLVGVVLFVLTKGASL